MLIIIFTLTFDSFMEQHVRVFWRALAQEGMTVEGLTGHRPHITLAAYEVEDVLLYTAALEAFVKNRPVLELHLDFLGVFVEKSVLFLAPRMSAALLTLHQNLLDYYNGPDKPPLRYPLLHKDIWQPHCTLVAGIEPGLLPTAVAVCQKIWQPVQGVATGIGVLVPPATVDFCQYPFGG